MSGDNTPKETPKRDPKENLAPAWQPGQSGNPSGRPKGARNKLTESFLDALLADFTKAAAEDASMGALAIEKMRTEKPNEYAKMIAGLLAKEVDASVNGDLSEEMKRWLGIG